MQSLFELLKIEKTYELLFPREKQGLAIIWLYERVKNGEFEYGIFKDQAGLKIYYYQYFNHRL